MKNLLALLTLCISLNCVAQKVTIALNLKQDSTYYLSTNANFTVMQNINGTQQVISTIMSGKIAHKVIAIRDTVYEMEVQYKSLGMHLDVAGKAMDFNSDDHDDKNVVSKIIRAMLNKPFTMVISKTGNVIEIKNSDNIYTSMFESFPQLTESQKQQFKTQMQQSFGEKSIKSNFQDAFAMFPTVKVALNEKWITHNNIESVISAKIKTTYILKGITSDAYLIHGDATILPDGSTGYKPFNGLEMRYDNVTGNATTELKLDKNTGWITEAKISKLIKGTVVIKDSQKTPGGLTFPMTVSGDMTVTGR